MTNMPVLTDPIEYEFLVSVDLGNMIPQVKEVLEPINDTLAMCGCEGKYIVRTTCITTTMKSNRELTPTEIDKVKEIMLSTYSQLHPSWSAKIESVRRKSGNVSQSALQ